jgi:hypothetical protein
MQGVTGGTPNDDTAAITFTATTFTATVTLHAPAGTFFSGQLTQGPICAPTENFQGTVPDGKDSVTVTVTDTLGFGATGAFVSVTKGKQFEITPLVNVPAGTSGGTVTFRKIAAISCSGTSTGTPTDSTAEITSTGGTVRADVTLENAKPNASYVIHLQQNSGPLCTSDKITNVTTNRGGDASATITASQTGTGASVFIVGPGDLQQTPDVGFGAGSRDETGGGEAGPERG